MCRAVGDDLPPAHRGTGVQARGALGLQPFLLRLLRGPQCIVSLSRPISSFHPCHCLVSPWATRPRKSVLCLACTWPSLLRRPRRVGSGWGQRL